MTKRADDRYQVNAVVGDALMQEINTRVVEGREEHYQFGRTRKKRR